jgi:Glycosyl hydrolases family 16
LTSLAVRRSAAVGALALPTIGLAGPSSARIVGFPAPVHPLQASMTSVPDQRSWRLRSRLSTPGLYEVRLAILPRRQSRRERVQVFIGRVARRNLLLTSRGVDLRIRTLVSGRTLILRVTASRSMPQVRAYMRLVKIVRAHASSAASRSPSISSTDPSGEPMPTGDLPGWRQVFADDFDGTTLNLSRWRTYSGHPGGDPGGWWAPSHVTVANGSLILSGYRDPAHGDGWTTGGVSSSPGLVQTYGKYLVRFRFDSGVGIAHAILLWPADNSWPPEIDFSEDNGANRRTDYATLHYGATNAQLQHSLSVDLTKWHTLGVEWTPGQLVYTIDGRDWATVTSPDVPSIPMVLDIQTQAWACGTNTWEQCPNATTPSHVNLYVDWVVAYART